jgi:hypothetical protein
MLKAILIVGVLFHIGELPAQKTDHGDQSFISWNPFYKLSWYDFQGTPPDESNSDAGASVQIKATPFMVKDKIHYNVAAIFNRKKSWARDQSRSLLGHEQLHFDLAEVYARKIRKRIAELEDDRVNDLKIYNAAIRGLLEESNRADRQYDIETLHGALIRQQEGWSKKVTAQLEQLEAYEKKKRRIGS